MNDWRGGDGDFGDDDGDCHGGSDDKGNENDDFKR